MSDKKFWHGRDNEWYYPSEDVAEFIRLLKEDYKLEWQKAEGISRLGFNKIVDKRAGKFE